MRNASALVCKPIGDRCDQRVIQDEEEMTGEYHTREKPARRKLIRRCLLERKGTIR